MTSKFSNISFKVADLPAVVGFYREVLGMVGDANSLGYGPSDARLTFLSDSVEPHMASTDQFYWKIGITVRDLDHAVRYLRSAGVKVSDPVQFRDIGYLCHLKDPAGLVIELLQQGFEGHAGDAGTGHPIGGQAVFAHITLRITDIQHTREWCENELGLRLLSIQPVTDYGFTLYFYAWSDEQLPDPELTSVTNREWLWARPYTILELQHLQSGDNGRLRHGDVDQAGPVTIGIVKDDQDLMMPFADLPLR